MASQVPAAMRRIVMQRANWRCEYCRVREQGSAFNLQVEHIISRPIPDAGTFLLNAAPQSLAARYSSTI